MIFYRASSPDRKPVETYRPLPAIDLPRLIASRPDWTDIWQYAKDNGVVIVSRDSDFQECSLVSSLPPQVIWLKIPNHSKTFTLNILLDHHQEIEHVLTERNLACVELSHRNK